MNSQTSKAQEERIEALTRTNPLFGNRKLKLGTFCSNVSGGATISRMDGVLEMKWDNIETLSRLSDEMEFEAILPIARWRGFGGATDFNGEQFEPLTYSAGVSAITSKPSVFATVHVPLIHPVLTAKQGATIDHISGGRFTLNVVTGWHRREIEMFGAPMLGHDERFDLAEEWVTLVKRLWTSEEPVSFEGKYYKVDDVLLRPRPIQPYPLLINASNSPIGMRFAAKHFDAAFMALKERDPASIRQQIAEYKTLAREEFGRELKVWINSYMVIGDSAEDAQRQLDYCVKEMGDFEAADNMVRELGMNTQGKSPEMLERMKLETMAGYAGYRLVGTPEHIVDEFKMLVDAGIDGTLLSWPAYLGGIQRFQEQVYPLLVQAGLR